MRKIWMVIANASKLKVYEITRQSRISMTLIEERIHPESRLKESELLSDSPGSYQSGQAHGSYEKKTSAKTVEADHFAREIIEFMHQGLNDNAFEGLVMVLSPAFEGILKKSLPKSLLTQVKHFVTKDYTEVSPEELDALLGSVFRPLMGDI